MMMSAQAVLFLFRVWVKADTLLETLSTRHSHLVFEQVPTGTVRILDVLLLPHGCRIFGGADSRAALLGR